MYCNKIKKKKINIWFVTVMILFAVVLHSITVYAHQQLLQQGIAEEVLRFHVLANSDSEEDQQVKYLVRDGVIAWVEKEMRAQEAAKIQAADTEKQETGSNRKSVKNQTADKKQEMEQFLGEHLSEITQLADQILAENGFSYHAEARIENCYFPDRTYGGCTFPAGWYRALRICLGEAKGQNWWCVLYPKLCFADCLHGAVGEEEMQELEKVLTVEEYESLLRQPGKWKISFRWF